MRAALGAAAVVCTVTAVLPGAAVAEAASVADGGGAGVERISVAADGTQADDNSAGASITPDGSRVVFSSSATNLTPDGTTGGDRVYVRDQRTGRTRQMGQLRPLQAPVISGDGAYVAYPVQWVNDVRIRQYQVSTGATASLNCSAYSCNQPSLSGDGGYVAHVVFSPGQPSFGQRIEVQNRSTGADQTVAAFGHTYPSRPSISGDGSKVVCLSGSDTYVHDVRSGTARLVPNARGLAIAPTGRNLLYAPQDTTGPSLTLLDLWTDTDETVSDRPATAGAGAVGAGGRDVVFQSTADDLVPGDTNGKSDVFVRHFS
ncbi:TolB family protein [Streptomyces sp. NRRL B-3648]|uniref:TolB family protein n=1 Tax=Streptomyces sp. NRRL B-3648 TaxID=1519493 RepID=UPI001F1F1122|nr:hypothetical protein [Streptomyces sp. NRRL B-3648]